MEGSLQSEEGIHNILEWVTKTTFLLFIAVNYSTVFPIYKFALLSSTKGKYERNNRILVTNLD